MKQIDERNDFVVKCGHISRKEVPTMGNKEAVAKYHAKLDEFKIRPYIEEGKQIRVYAETTGQSVQGLFLEAVREYIKNNPK